MNEQIDLAEFLVIAERVLGVDAKALKPAAAPATRRRRPDV